MNPISTANKTGELKAAYQRPMESPFQDQAFEDFAHLASSVSGAPIAVLSLAMGSRQRFSTVVGLSGPEPSLISIFRDVIACQTDPLIVPDTLADARFAESLPHSGAIVGETPHVRFYAGVPLINSEGIVIGELSVMDTRPRNISARRIDALCRLGRHVVEMIEMRRRVYDLEFTVNKRKKATSMLEARNRDLTAQKSALEDQAQSLRRSTDDMLEGNALYAYASRRFLELFQGLPVACYCYDSRGRVFEWNRAFELL
jgi:GAF domain-containing protein